MRLGIAQVPQGRGTFTDLTRRGQPPRRRVRAPRSTRSPTDIALWYETFPRLAERRSQKAGRLSGGEQQMLAIARALMSRPKLLLCDEPSLGLAPLITKELFEIIKRLNEEQGLSVLLVEQNANLAIDIAHHVYLLETGQHRGRRAPAADRRRRRGPPGLPGVLTVTCEATSSSTSSTGCRSARSTR